MKWYPLSVVFVSRFANLLLNEVCQSPFANGQIFMIYNYLCNLLKHCPEISKGCFEFLRTRSEFLGYAEEMRCVRRNEETLSISSDFLIFF